MMRKQLMGLPILLVEDDNALRTIFADGYGQYAAKVHEEHSVATAVREANREPDKYRCCVLDLNLPDSSGLATLTKMRAETHIPVIIVLTGLPDMEMDCMRAGAWEVLTKPVALEELLKRTAMAMARYNTITEHWQPIQHELDTIRREHEEQRADDSRVSRRTTATTSTSTSKTETTDFRRSGYASLVMLPIMLILILAGMCAWLLGERSERMGQHTPAAEIAVPAQSLHVETPVLARSGAEKRRPTRYDLALLAAEPVRAERRLAVAELLRVCLSDTDDKLVMDARAEMKRWRVTNGD